jgi:putative acetyltransferase
MVSEMNAQDCRFVEHPTYYWKFGFKNVSDLGRAGLSQEVPLARAFEGRQPRGTVAFHEAFQAGGHEKHQSTDANI